MELIQNVGFPVLISFVLLKLLNDEKTMHKEETAGFIRAIDNNTQAIERVVDIVEDLQQERIDRKEVFDNE